MRHIQTRGFRKSFPGKVISFMSKGREEHSRCICWSNEGTEKVAKSECREKMHVEVGLDGKPGARLWEV